MKRQPFSPWERVTGVNAITSYGGIASLACKTGFPTVGKASGGKSTFSHGGNVEPAGSKPFCFYTSAIVQKKQARHTLQGVCRALKCLLVNGVLVIQPIDDWLLGKLRKD
ncbi:hypothetical protein KEM09_06040 [Carboxylicivirga mesophila]|uniref:Uncharacterized protein n=1 Tax=Carboxylicivirga mesophila TaxID=1166478 RepID=A0ABS5K7J2_9BACT|nr:hypothetical protein [Carboxylicivirga mesophila]MBS2210950.1 hypothetical protein [Carboxylicivirga mesophila]